MRELVRELALALRERVLPLLGAHAQRAHSGASDGGDVTFDADDAALREQYLAVDGKVAPLAAGTTLTQRQVTEVMLVESANNYATALARWAFGDDASFAAAAAAWLAGHGLDAGEENRSGAELGGAAEGAVDVGGRPAGGDAHDDVA